MWNFLVSGLSLGCTLVLYDGSPLRDVSLLWKLVDDLGITIFGTSAKFLDQLSVRFLICYSVILKCILTHANTETLSPSRASQFKHATTHLFNGLATSSSSVRLCLPAYPPRGTIGFNYRFTPFLQLCYCQ